MGLTTVRAIIDAARVRHWSFAAAEAGDGPAMLFLNSRLRTHLATHGATIEGLIGTTMQYTMPFTPPTLVAPPNILGSPYQDGWPIHVTGGGVPYVDFSEPALAGDPFGAHGGTPGFPLPGDMVRLIAVALVYSQPTGQVIPCDVVPEGQRFTTLPGRNPACFVSQNRLVPVQPLASGNSGGRWDNVTAIQISYVAVQTLRTLDDQLNLPSVLAEALIADLAQYFAMQSKQMLAPEKGMFAAEAQRCGGLISAAALDLLNEPQSSTVHYTG